MGKVEEIKKKVFRFGVKISHMITLGSRDFSFFKRVGKKLKEFKSFFIYYRLE